MSKYERPAGPIHKKPKDKRVRANVTRLNEQYKNAVKDAKSSEMLLQESAGFLEAEDEMERTFKVKQDEIKEAVDASMNNKAIDLKLNEFGPYVLDYSRNGRDLLIGGRKGHVASMDWQYGTLNCELHLQETVSAVKHLHNDQFFAVAQKKYTFIYDKLGAEVHRLNQHIEVKHLDFLPYHFLLVTSGNTGHLKYQDVSTGQLVSELKTKKGPTRSMAQNPWNAIMHLGHSDGQVSLWAPSMSQPVAQILCARGAISSLAVNRDGRYMASVATDKSVKLWDLRMFKELHSAHLPTPGTNVSISDTNLLGLSFGPNFRVYKDTFKKSADEPMELYMSHLNAGSRIEDMKFVPFEDLICLGHEQGVKNLIIPGAGEANFDSLEVNPFESAKQRQESEVRGLLNKLKPDMITLDPSVIGNIDKRAQQVRLTKYELEELEKKNEKQNEIAIKPKVKGKNSKLRSHLRKKSKYVIDERKLKIEENLKREKNLRKRIAEGKTEVDNDPVTQALSRFG